MSAYESMLIQSLVEAHANTSWLVSNEDGCHKIFFLVAIWTRFDEAKSIFECLEGQG